MSVKYHCRYCQAPLGEISGDLVNEYQLGFHFLTPEERRDIISYNREGDTVVHVVCDYCKEALETHPELSLLGNPLQ